MRFLIAASALTLAATAAGAQTTAPATSAPATSAPATTQGAAAAPAGTADTSVRQGATVYDAQGGVVGTIEAVDGQYATVATTKNKAKLPLSAFGKGAKGPAIAMTAAQLDEAAAAAAPPQQAAATPQPVDASKLAKGTAVNDTKGAKVATVEQVDGQFVVVATAKNKVRLPLSAFADAGSGPVIGMSEAELDAAAEAAKPKTASK